MPLKNCANCNVEISVIPSLMGRRSYCSKLCTHEGFKKWPPRKGMKNSESAKAKQRAAKLGAKNHRFGMKASEETRLKMSKAQKGHHGYWTGKKQTAETIAKRVEKLRIPCSEEKKKKISVSNKGKIRSPQACKGQSERTIVRLQNGWIPSDCAKHGKFFSKKNNRELHYRSSYELRALQKLEVNIEVISFDVEAMRIPYIWRGKERIYLPDIWVLYRNKTQQIIEVKAAWNINDDRVQAKLKAAELFCSLRGIAFIVWTEKDII